MPITIDEKVALDDATAAFSDKDSVIMARLLYETLLHAKKSGTNPMGMGFKACTSLGRMVKEKAGWDKLQSIEGAIEEAIRLPLIKSTDQVFKVRIATDLPDLAEEHKQTIAYVFGKMDANELMNLTRLLYETVCNTEFPSQEAQDAFGKLYYSGYTWEELARSEEIKKGILGPFVLASHYFLREALSNAFEISEPETAAPEEGGESSETQEGQPPDTEKIEGAPSAGIVSDDENEEVSEEQSAQPMPLPDFATKDEIEERRKQDAAKPTFRGKSKKNKKNKKRRANGQSAAAEGGASPEDDSEKPETDEQETEAPESTSDAVQEGPTGAETTPATDETRDAENASGDSEADSEPTPSTQEDETETASQETQPS